MLFREGVIGLTGAGGDPSAGSGCDERQKKKCEFEYGEFYEWACKNCDKK